MATTMKFETKKERIDFINNLVWEEFKKGLESKEKWNEANIKIQNIVNEYCSYAERKSLYIRKRASRTWMEFIKNIYENTIRETETFRLVMLGDMQKRGFIIDHHENTGIDNNGRPIFVGYTDVDRGTPDYYIISKNKLLENNRFEGKVDGQYIEIKDNLRTNKCVTYLVTDLNRYNDRYNSCILTRMKNHWLMLGPNFISGLLKNWPVGSYKEFCRGEEAIRISEEQYLKLGQYNIIGLYRWDDNRPFKAINDTSSFTSPQEIEKWELKSR